jgi:hypothetical protein
MAIAYVLLNLATITWFPRPWVDEVMYTDPAVNFLLGDGFVSSAWQSQPRSAFWAGNTPLHEWFLIPWMSLFGIGPAAARSINVVMVAASCIVLCWAAVRCRMVSAGIGVVVIAILFFTSLGMAAIARDGRPDGVKVLVVVLALLAYTAIERWRLVALFAVGCLAVPAGFQAASFLCMACMVAWGWLGRRFLKYGFALGAGCIVGFLALMLMYALHGQARSFLENTLASGHTLSGDLAQAAVFSDGRVGTRLGNRLEALTSLPSVLSIDPAHPWLLGLCIAASAAMLAKSRWSWKSAFTALVLLAVLAPPASMMIGKYFLHYTWIGFLPLTLAVAVAITRLSSSQKVLAMVVIAVVALMGFPRELVLNGDAEGRTMAAVESFASRHLVPGDRVCADHVAFFAVIASGARFQSSHYAGGRGLPEVPDEDRQAVTALLVEPSNLGAVVEKFGGTWSPVASLILPDPNGVPQPLLTLLRRSSNG